MRSRGALGAICLGFFMIMLDATVVTTALPAIGRDLDAGIDGLQWVTAGYTLVFACLLLTAGALGDRLGPRRVFLTGLVVFALASAACGLAPGTGVLIAARVVQGAGAALALPASLALVGAVFLDRAGRARAIGVWAGLGGLAAGLGPVVGGVLTAVLGWRAIFFVNLPVAVLAVPLIVRCVPAPAPARRTGLDPWGQALSVVTVAALAHGLIEAPEAGWTAPLILGSFAVALAAGVAFVLVERHGGHPVLPPGLFAGRGFGGALLIGAAINTGFYGELFLLTLYFQDVRGWSPLLSGLAMLPQAGVASVASPLGGRRTARSGARPVLLTGLVTGALGLLALVFVPAGVPYWVLVAPLLAIGFGTSYTMPAATAATMDAAPPGQAGTASGALNAGRQVGSTLGVAVMGSLTAGAGAFLSGFHVSVLIGGLVFAGGAVAALTAVPRPPASDTGCSAKSHARMSGA